jgi:hypothetical protein
MAAESDISAYLIIASFLYKMTNEFVWNKNSFN